METASHMAEIMENPETLLLDFWSSNANVPCEEIVIGDTTEDETMKKPEDEHQ